MLAHRPGFVAPTLAARKLATLDQFSGGRLAVHIISGGDNADQAKDGDFLPHDERYARTDEYVEILRRIWTADKPYDHEGKYYKFLRSFSDVKPIQKPHIPIYFGGASDAAIAIAGKHADVYALWGEPLAEAAKTIAQVRASAARHGRQVRFSLSTRPILAATEDAAWAARGRSSGGSTKFAAMECSARRPKRRRRSARSGCWLRPRMAKCSIGDCGPRLPRRPARVGILPRWWELPSKWRNRCWPTTSSA